jgi:aromatic ring-opening dioxygenase LigB subunit
MPPDGPEPEDDGVPEEFREALDALHERRDEIDDVARGLGLYIDQSNLVVVGTPHGMKAAMALDVVIGDVAFSPRVQNPQDYDIDKSFAQMQVNMADDDFLDSRTRIQQNIQEGRDPLDDGDNT